jgi:hypothetical protein
VDHFVCAATVLRAPLIGALEAPLVGALEVGALLQRRLAQCVGRGERAVS